LFYSKSNHTSLYTEEDRAIGTQLSGRVYISLDNIHTNTQALFNTNLLHIHILPGLCKI